MQRWREGQEEYSQREGRAGGAYGHVSFTVMHLHFGLHHIFDHPSPLPGRGLADDLGSPGPVALQQPRCWGSGGSVPQFLSWLLSRGTGSAPVASGIWVRLGLGSGWELPVLTGADQQGSGTRCCEN